MKKHLYTSKGSMHLISALAILVVVAVAAIGVKIYSTSHANELSSNLISITSPTANQTIYGYKPIFANAKPTERQVVAVKFFANGKYIQGVGLSKCYPSGPSPTLAPRTYVVCFDTTSVPNGPYRLVAKMIFLNGTSVQSYPVPVNINQPDPAPLTVKITSPANNANVSGYVPAVIAYSSNVKSITLLANGKPVVGAELSECYPNAMPTPVPYTTTICLNSQDVAYVTTPSIVLKATAYEAGGTRTVTDTITVYHPIPYR